MTPTCDTLKAWKFHGCDLKPPWGGGNVHLMVSVIFKVYPLFVLSLCDIFDWKIVNYDFENPGFPLNMKYSYIFLAY